LSSRPAGEVRLEVGECQTGSGVGFCSFAQPPSQPLWCTQSLILLLFTSCDHKQAKAADALDHERQQNREADAHAVLSCANELREPEGLRIDELTEGCTNATASSSREFCQNLDRLKAQLDVAATATVLREKIEKLNKSIEALRSQGAGQVASWLLFCIPKPMEPAAA
jgi:hypothetical protein